MNEDHLDPDKHLYTPDPLVDMDYCMPSHYQQIKEFMQVFEQECPDKPIIPDLAIRKLRAKTILEEALERINALGLAVLAWDTYEHYELKLDEHVKFEDLYEFSASDFLDGVCDAEYFDLGSLIALGISEEKYQEHFEKVHKANMGKLWTREEIEQDWPEARGMEFIDGSWHNSSGIQSRYIKRLENYNNRCFLVRNKDGKVIKPPSFKAPETMI